MLWDILQEIRISKNREDISRNKNYVENLSKKNFFDSGYYDKTILELQYQIDQLSLLFRTLYDLGLKKGHFTKEEFKEFFNQIDLEDGKADGKLSNPEN